jgi:endonuclease I
MKRLILFILVLLLSKITFAQPPAGYYNSASGLSGYQLKTALYNIIKDHNDQGYTALWSFYEYGDTLPQALTNSGVSSDIIWDIYSYNPDGANPYEYVAGSNQCGTYSGEGSCYNREHTFPQSWFNKASPMKNDVVQVLPTDGFVNNKRSNYPYSEVNASWTSQNGSKLGTSNVAGFSGTAFEPIDEFKGDLARIYFYMATRYENVIAGWQSNANADDVLDGTSDHVYDDWFLDLMMQWHEQDPVSQKELDRNNDIYDFQNNRNPFVDHPEYAESIWGYDTIKAEPSNHVANFSTSAVTDSTIALTWNDNDGAVVADYYLVMINTTGIFTAPVDSVPQNDDTDLSDNEGEVNINHGSQAYTWEGLDTATIYYFTIYPYTNSGSNVNYKTDGSVPATQDTTSATQSSGNNGNSDSTYALIISEIADPGDNTGGRFVELYNRSNYDIDFSGQTWYLSRQANAGSWGDILLTGVLKADSTMVIGNSSSNFNAAYGFNPDIVNGSISGNGNDGYFLFKDGDHSTGTLVDAYGEIDVNGTGTAWEYEDSKAVRLYTVDSASATWNASEWKIESADVADMTPKWHHKTYYWTGAVSTDWFNINNWQVNSTTPDYFYDAGSYLIINSAGNNPTLSSSDTIFCTKLKADSNAVLTIGAGVLKVGK